jgi:hypothetical protein
VGDVAIDIRAPSSPRNVAAIAELAAHQHGVVAHRQLLQLGLRPGAIKHALAIGRLYRLHIGVYAVGHCIVSGKGRFMAAVLACGPGALLSHVSAAAHLGLRRSDAVRIDVTARRTLRGRPGIRLHRVRHVHPEDATRVDGIPVTSVSRTLLDLAEVLQPRQLERVLGQAERLELFDLIAMERLIARSHGRRGLRPLTALLLAARAPPPTKVRARGGFGRRLPGWWIADAGDQRARRRLRGRCLWEAQRLVVEVDSWEFHRGRQAFENDRARDPALLLGGYRVVRVTWRMLRDHAAEVAEMLRRLLAARGGDGG